MDVAVADRSKAEARRGGIPVERHAGIGIRVDRGVPPYEFRNLARPSRAPGVMADCSATMLSMPLQITHGTDVLVCRPPPQVGSEPCRWGYKHRMPWDGRQMFAPPGPCAGRSLQELRAGLLISFHDAPRGVQRGIVFQKSDAERRHHLMGPSPGLSQNIAWRGILGIDQRFEHACEGGEFPREYRCERALVLCQWREYLRKARILLVAQGSLRNRSEMNPKSIRVLAARTNLSMNRTSGEAKARRVNTKSFRKASMTASMSPFADP